MSINRTFSIGLLIFSLLILSVSPGCKSRKGVCDANNQYSMKKMKKNRSNYGTRYEFKSKPVKKNYVIRNGR